MPTKDELSMMAVTADWNDNSLQAVAAIAAAKKLANMWEDFIGYDAGRPELLRMDVSEVKRMLDIWCEDVINTYCKEKE